MRFSGLVELAIDRHLPTLAAFFAVVVSPILIHSSYTDPHALDGRPENRIFWPAMILICLALLLRDSSRFSKLPWPPNIVVLLLYIGFAGLSVTWAYSPKTSFIRFAQQVMVVLSIVIPTRLARKADLIHGLFLAFAVSLVLNSFYVMAGSVTMAQYGARLVNIGYEGYFEGKNYLGECAAIALLLSLYEISRPGWRRAAGIIFGALSVELLVLSNSKTAFGLALACPLLARVTLIIRRMTRASPAAIILMLPLAYFAVSSVSNFNMDRIAFILYHDSTLTGRTIIWAFAQSEIARRPLLGWGYQSFWFVPNSPALTDAPGWVKMMPNAHNGYYDTMLELGYVGLTILLSFIIATLHVTGRVADRDPARARIVLSLVLFVTCYNYFESLWMRGFEFLWVVFLIAAAEAARYWQTVPAKRSAPARSRAAAAGFRRAGATPFPPLRGRLS